MKCVYIFFSLFIVLLTNDDNCANDAALDRKLMKLRKLKSLTYKHDKKPASAKRLERFSKTESAELSLKDFATSNSYWSRQWHLHKDQYPSMGVIEAWEMGYTGKGVVVAVVGDGLDTEHYDLAGNFDSSLSYDFVNDEFDVSYKLQAENHTTRFAGIIAAMKNDDCITGIAYEVTLAVLHVLKKSVGVKDKWFANAWTYKPDEIDILSHGIGIGVHQGYGFYPLSELLRSSLIKSVKKGRRGKGSIIIFGSGIDGEHFDDCNTQEYMSSIYTISVSPLAPDGGPAVYTEECTCVLTAAYAGEDYYNGTKKYLVIVTFMNWPKQLLSLIS